MLSIAVLDDLEHCLKWLEDESDEFRFRMVLIASVALVRTVGHVLRNVDGRHDPVLMEMITKRFDEWKRDKAKARIFWEFIDIERNSILKEYDLRFDFSPMVTTAEADHAWRIGSNLYCPVAEGTYAGEDVRDVLREAVTWWRAQVSSIVQELQVSRGAP